MQKTALALLGLLLSIAGNLCAQNNKKPSAGTRLFEPPDNSIGINYRINLGKGNILRIDLANGYDLHSLANIDSILNFFLDDMQAFRDTLADPLTVKRIDYLIDTSGTRKLRIRQYRPAASSFLLDHNGPSILRVEQDTIRILIVTAAPGRSSGRTVNGLRYDRFCFFLNHYEELESYARNGLNAWTRHILANPVPRHPYRCPFCYIVADSGITTRTRERNGLQLGWDVAMQNYKSYSAPAFAVGGKVVLTRGKDHYLLGASWEPIFLFGADPQGRLATYRNDFVVVTFNHNGPAELKYNPFADVSFGYLFHSQGNFFDKPSFRFTLGSADFLHGSLHIEPGLFFNNFFKGVTPTLKLSFGLF